MGGRLPPSVAAIRVAVRACCSDVEPGTRVIVACSGGADSMALAAATVFEGRAAGWLVSAAVVDHGLQEGSVAVAATVVERLGALDCPAEVLTAHVGTAGGPEAAARDARYAALEDHAAAGDAVVLLGHTRDDQAETVLLGLARGSGTRSLAGMAPRRGRFRRPLLGLGRADTAQACADAGIEVWDDPHNADDRYARVRVRHRVLPVLEAELGPGVTDALARTARSARDDADALDQWAADAYAEAASSADAGGGLDTTVLERLPAAVLRRVLRAAALAAGCPGNDLTAHHLAAVSELVHGWRGQGPIDLPGGRRAQRAGRVVVVRAAEAEPPGA